MKLVFHSIASDNRAKTSELVSKQSGFSLHTGVGCKSHQWKKLERLCRYITRPAIAEQRLSLASNGNVIKALPFFCSFFKKGRVVFRSCLRFGSMIDIFVSGS
ncbi:transposase [Pseudomonadales bacterium]|nr:transposase [Pseudomonadales bacterium]